MDKIQPIEVVKPVRRITFLSEDRMEIATPTETKEIIDRTMIEGEIAALQQKIDTLQAKLDEFDSPDVKEAVQTFKSLPVSEDVITP